MLEALRSHSPEYQKVHRCLEQTYGKATDYFCANCPETALDWAWIHNTDPYDLGNYEPMCRSCHLDYDMTPEWRKQLSHGRKASGENHGRAKLSESDVAEIRELYAGGNWTLADLSHVYGVHTSQIHRIVKGQRWTPIKEKK